MRCLHSSFAVFRAGRSSRHVIHSTVTGGGGGGGATKSGIDRKGSLRCFCGVDEVDLLLATDGAFVDSAIDGILPFLSGV
jgi:hypothetical protein